jgi:hypothetical protein
MLVQRRRRARHVHERVVEAHDGAVEAEGSSRRDVQSASLMDPKLQGGRLSLGGRQAQDIAQKWP